MKDALEFIVSSIVDNPEKASVTEEEQDGVIQFVIAVAKEDMGKVIGKEGKVIRSIRNVLKIRAIKENKRIAISLSENAS